MRRFNVYYIGSVVMLFVMGYVFIKARQDMGIALWQSHLSPATVWSHAIQGEFNLEGSPQASVRIDTAAVDVERFKALEVLQVTLSDSLDTVRALLAVNDFEDDQVLLEWYEPGFETWVRRDGCELLMVGDTSRFFIQTLGDMCYSRESDSSYLNISLSGSKDSIILKVTSKQTSDEALVREVQYRLLRTL